MANQGKRMVSEDLIKKLEDLQPYKAGKGIEITDENVINNTQNNVIANPTLAGTEDLLNGLQVGDTKYAMPHLCMYIGDANDLSLPSTTTVGNSNYYKFLTTLDNIKKLSDLPNGEYQVVCGTIIDSSNTETQIQSIIVNNGIYEFYLCNDDQTSFTISIDNTFTKIQLF